MNKLDRKHYAMAMKMVAEAKELVAQALEEFERLADAEKEKFDNMSEGLQQSETGQKLEKNYEVLYDAQEKAQDAFDTLEELEGMEGDIE